MQVYDSLAKQMEIFPEQHSFFNGHGESGRGFTVMGNSQLNKGQREERSLLACPAPLSA